MNYITILLVINIAAAIYTIIKTHKSGFSSDTKTLLYVMSVVTPLIGFFLFLIKNKKIKNYSRL
jgi:hypothetical protein